MSPHIALHDPVFRNYFWIVLISLAIAGAVLAFLRFVWKKESTSMFKTYYSWILIAGLGFMVVFLGRIPTIVGITLLAICAFKEFAHASGLCRDSFMTGAVYAGIVTAGIASLISRPGGDETGQGWYGLFVALPAYGIASILLIPILLNLARGELQRISLTIIGFVYIGWMFGHLAFMANSRNAYGYICYIILATALTDVAAFTFGNTFGRHPLRSEISPKKTWEGAIGAFVIAMILPWVLRFSFPFFGPLQLFLTGLIVGIGGQLGDLSISLIKRDIGIKDMAATIPGHGGILDRIDSLVYAAPLFMYMAAYYYPLR
jgi:phosphatidate cytidylyltransferase